MEKFFRSKKDIMFWIIAVMIFLILLSFSIYAISFLVNKFNLVLNYNLIKEGELVRFNLNKVKELRR